MSIFIDLKHDTYLNHIHVIIFKIVKGILFFSDPETGSGIRYVPQYSKAIYPGLKRKEKAFGIKQSKVMSSTMLTALCIFSTWQDTQHCWQLNWYNAMYCILACRPIKYKVDLFKFYLA